ncbi:MAG: dihydroorotase, partial [Candidatus Muiribacteriaceae bacterium]
MSERLLLKSGICIVSGILKKRDILCEDGIISEIAENITDTECEVIDCTGRYVMPGAIDSHVYFNDPGYNHREDFYTGTKAALRGGVTTVIDMPSANIPATRNVDLLQSKLAMISKKANCDFALCGGVTADDIEKKQWDDIAQLLRAGVCGLEVYMNTNMPSFNHVDNGQLLELMSRLSDAGYIFLLHAEDFEICDYNIRIARMKNRNYPKAWSEARPPIAEEIAFQTSLAMAHEHNIRLHYINVSSEKAMNVVKRGKQEGLNITCSTTPVYLEMNENDLNTLGNMSKVIPPIRTKKDNTALWMGINSGIVDIICS